MANQTGIAITIKAFLPTGKTLDEQFAALSIVKDAHSTGDYSALLKAAGVEEVKTEQKTRRIEDQPQTRQEPASGAEGGGEGPASGFTTGAAPDLADAAHTDPGPATSAAADADVPEFLKKDKKSKAA
ncbi:hypothetical protein RFM23_05510 [Mesorhizobium abyssinicae]|uniref:Uncharacterized protein n=1 Tax=Mesorhizobium abyssinicae TaxID=1209958 RepID=A0ABU5AIH5_9HYPH|nr:hypothetical protein [Mesorhizobium abyssinicae]MDX8537080.1 hypothetical protein [Mesorhizobium abyssinicae]